MKTVGNVLEIQCSQSNNIKDDNTASEKKYDSKFSEETPSY
jgi:hypothetical protein